MAVTHDHGGLHCCVAVAGVIGIDGAGTGIGTGNTFSIVSLVGREGSAGETSRTRCSSCSASSLVSTGKRRYRSGCRCCKEPEQRKGGGLCCFRVNGSSSRCSRRRMGSHSGSWCCWRPPLHRRCRHRVARHAWLPPATAGRAPPARALRCGTQLSDLLRWEGACTQAGDATRCKAT